jgi:hypothetical protein
MPLIALGIIQIQVRQSTLFQAVPAIPMHISADLKLLSLTILPAFILPLMPCSLLMKVC